MGMDLCQELTKISAMLMRPELDLGEGKRL
jgi:hypothetical protein